MTKKIEFIERLERFKKLIDKKKVIEERYTRLVEEIQILREEIYDYFGKDGIYDVKHIGEVKLTKTEYTKDYPSWQTIATKFLSGCCQVIESSRSIKDSYKKTLKVKIARMYYEIFHRFKNEKDETRIYITISKEE